MTDAVSLVRGAPRSEAAALNFRPDGRDEPSELAIAPARSRISPRETLSFQMRGRNLNPLLDAAAPLLGLAARVRTMEAFDDIETLHRRVENDIQAFDAELADRTDESDPNRRGYDQGALLAARYCLCSMIDESVMSTVWGAESSWPEKTMLSIFHNETWGGEKFFAVLERAMEQPARFQDLIEFLYVCVGLGFEGKFHVTHQGASKLDRLLDTVYRVVQKRRGEAPERFCAPEQAVVARAPRLARFTPLWLTALLGFGGMALIYFVFRLLLDGRAAEIAAQVDKVL